LLRRSKVAAVRAEIPIERLSKLGQGVGKLEGRSVFVDGGLPGERVLVDVEPSGKLLRGHLLKVLTPSLGRRVPGCALSDRCGGCDWLHLDEASQREAKLEIVLSSLEHLGGIRRTDLRVRPMRVSECQMGYRRRAAMHLRDGQLCLHGRRSHDSVAIQSCPALIPALADLPGRLGPKLAKLSRAAKAVHLLGSAEGASFAVFLVGPVRRAHLETCERAVRELELLGAVLVPAEGPAQIVGEPAFADAHDSAHPQSFIRPDSFAQASSEGNAALRSSVLDLLAPQRNERILELHCGNANLTFCIAGACAEVIAVESSAAALELARRGAGKSRGRIRFIQGDADKVCQALASEGLLFDALVLDPPRAGAPHIGEHARRLGCSRVVYVSCDPAALARDAQGLRACGFEPTSLQLIDMFPQTRHVEAVMNFVRQASSDGSAKP
jgi:23S rRNA (uracil1939-C5)-methyltransferase